MSKPHSMLKKRAMALSIFFTFLLFVISLRLGYINLIWGRELRDKAQDQWQKNEILYPKRGMIKDRNGNILAQSGSSETIIARPDRIANPKETSEILAEILNIDQESLYNKLIEENSNFAYVKRQADREEAARIKELGLRGIDFEEEAKRYYPNSELASHVLGYTMRYSEGEEGLKGQDGIELYYDEYLRGYTGRAIIETDARGRDMPDGKETIIPAVDGLNVVLTIDQVIQHFTEKAMDKAYEEYNPKKIYAIVMDPRNGEILALGNRPNFDPNSPPRDLGYEGMQDYVKNFLAKDIMDPGSVFKILIAAAAVNEGIIKEDTVFNCKGYIELHDDDQVRCHNKDGHGRQNLSEAMQNSCNPAFVEIVNSLGRSKLYKYFDDFGLNDYTGIDVIGEEKGLVISREAAKDLDIARMGFGQSISLTPLQLITAVSSVINGGEYYKPHLLKALTETSLDEETGELYDLVVNENEPEKLKTTISKETSDIMNSILKDVVEKGSGQNARIEGYSIAGKTGTAQKYDEDGKIMADSHIASFLGFAPSDNPEIVVLFIVDEPDTDFDHGSIVAAPYVRMILEDTLPYLGLNPLN